MKMLEDLFDIDSNPIEPIIGTLTNNDKHIYNNINTGYISDAQWNKSTKTGSITLGVQDIGSMNKPRADRIIKIDNNFVDILKDYYISNINCDGYSIDTFNTSIINPRVNLTVDNCGTFKSNCNLENVTIKSKVFRVYENFNYKNCNIYAEDYIQISATNYMKKYMLHSLQIPFVNCKLKTKKLQATFIGSLETKIDKDSFYFEKTFNTKGWDVDIYEFYFVDDYGSDRLFATKNKSDTKGWFEYKKSKDNYYYRIGVV